MKTLLTHNGTFHADDVFAVATFLLAHPEEKWQVVRSRERDAIEKADAVLDTGNVCDPKTLRFDHHQAGGAGMRENGIPYAAFGLVWKEYGAMICGGDISAAAHIDESLVCSLDANDNGVKLYTENFAVAPFELSHYVKIENPTWKEEEEWGDAADAKRLETFLKLVDWARSIILREIKRSKDKSAASELVKEAYAKAEDKRIVLLDRFYPWADAILEFPEPLMVVYPADRGMYGNWVAKAVPKEKNSFENRRSFPEAWAGKRDEELQKVSGVSDATFCHNARFLAIAGSREGAIRLAELAVK